jgi:hypothetical protein
MNFRFVVSVVGALLLAGCGGNSVGGQGDSPTAAPHHPSGPAAVTIGDPCEGGPGGCVSVGKVDVDGDGVIDAVAIASRENPATITIRVATADGIHERLLQPEQLPIPDEPLPAGAFVGAFIISRTKGADLVVQSRFGRGDSDEFHVIGWRDGELVDVPRPPVVAGDADPAGWSFFGSHGNLVWVTCDGDAAITVNNHSAPTAEGIPIPGGGILQSDHWKFTDGQWTAQGSENVQAGDVRYDPSGRDVVFRCEDQRR